MPNSFTIFGITLYIYGLLIGVAMIVVARISEEILKRNGYKGEVIWDLSLWVILVGLIGARAWHVATDWPLYANDLIKSLYIWQGGLSILGGVLGGIIGLYLSRRILKKYSVSPMTVLDVFAISLPFGQAIGRLGNWVNQELYGYPTDLPWKLFIDKQHRVSGFEMNEFFHPLFAYEALLLLLMGIVFWNLSQKKPFVVGNGILVLLYFVLYSGLRFFLEFLRIDKTTFIHSALGLNQVILAVVFFISLVVLFLRWNKQKAMP